MPNWGDLEIFVELPLSLISITTIAISYGLIVLILRQQRTRMRGHTKPKVNQVAPASCEKRPDSSINNVTKVTVLDASDKVKSSHRKAVDGVNQEAISSSDKVKNVLEVSSNFLPEVGTEVSSSEKGKNSLQTEEDVKQQARVIIMSSESVENLNEATREISSGITPSQNVASLGDVSHWLPADNAANHHGMNLLKAENETVHQDFVTTTASATCNSCGGTRDVNKEYTRNIIKDINVDINVDNMIIKGANNLKKGENTLLQINRDGLVTVDNSVDHKCIYNASSCDHNLSVSSSVMNNDNTSESHNIVLTTPEDNNFMISTQPVILNSSDIRMESAHQSPRRLRADCQHHLIDFIDVVTLHPNIDSSSSPTTPVYETQAQSTNSQTRNGTGKLSLPPNRIQACSQFDLASESAEENTFKISNSSLLSKNFLSCGNRLAGCVEASTHTPQNLNEVILAINSPVELPQSNNFFLEISKVQNTHLNSTEFLQTNTHVHNILHSKKQTLSVPLVHRNDAISLQRDNCSPPELFVVQIPQLSGNDENENTISCNNYQTSSISSCNGFNSPDLVFDLTSSNSIDPKQFTENLDRKPHHPSPGNNLSHTHQDVQPICDNCIESLSSPCCHCSGNIIPSQPNSTDKRSFPNGNFENYQDQSVTLQIPTKQTSPDSTKSVNENYFTSMSNTSIPLTASSYCPTIHQPVSIDSSEGKQLQCQCIDRVVLPVVTINIGTDELVSNIEADQLNCDKGAHSSVSINEVANVTSDKIYVHELANDGSAKVSVDKSTIVTSDKVSVAKSYNVISDKSTVDESAIVTSDKVMVTELANVTSDKVMVTELANVTSDKVMGTELANVTSDKVMGTELANVTSDKVMVTELANVTSDKVMGTELANVTSDKATVAELAIVTSDKVTVAELANVTSGEVTVAELANVTKDKVTSHLTPIKSAMDGKRFEVVDMDGTVHMQLVNSSHPTAIEGAVCLMNPRNKEQGKRRVELKAALKVGLLVCCFVCLWMPLPISICIFRGTFGEYQTMKVDILAVFSALATSTAAVDPILYGLLNRQIRSALLASVMKMRRKIRNCRK